MDSADMTAADWLAGWGDNTAANYTAYDAADNGAVNQSPGQASVSSPGWLDSLNGLFTGAVNTATGMIPGLLAGNQKSGNTGVVVPAKTTTQTASSGAAKSWTAYLPWILGGAGLLIVLALVLRK